MSLFFIKNTKQIGNVPGSLDFIGNKKTKETTVSIMSYNKEEIYEVEDLQDISPEDLSDKQVHWINVYGLHDIDKINHICQKFNVENLTTEDILNTRHIPKYEEFENYKTFMLKNVDYDVVEKSFKLEQISILVFNNAVICFQEQPSGTYDKLRERIRQSKGRIRKSKANYLLFAILDIIVETYINEVSKIGINIESLGKRIFEDNDSNIEQQLYTLKTETSHLRMQIFPVKELIIRMVKSVNTNIEKSTKPFFDDLIEMSTQANSNIELCNVMIVDQISTYNTLMSNKMNQTMKILTIFASIFIPLTFLAGIYGMNFEYMPELAYKYSYPIFWLVIILTTVGLVYYFKRNKWI